MHGFYALMGGFAITIPGNLPKSEAFVPAEACGTWFITGFGLKFLLKMDKDQLPPLTEEEIKSKSKANGLAKTFVCFQAIWFIATCIARCKYRSLQAMGNLRNVQSISDSWSSNTTSSYQLARAQYVRSCCVCAIYLSTLVGKAFRSRYAYHNQISGSSGRVCSGLDHYRWCKSAPVTVDRISEEGLRSPP